MVPSRSYSLKQGRVIFCLAEYETSMGWLNLPCELIALKEITRMEKSAHVHLLHNPKAGDQDHIKEELIRRIESQGFTCQYASVKEKGWKLFKSGTALVVIAGGDGTVRDVLKNLLNRRILDKPLAVALMPIGTANNFAKTLEISADLDAFERSIQDWKLKQVDIGLISNLGEARFFIEGVGLGLIPKLMKEMKSADFDKVCTAEEELELALEKLLEIVETCPAKRAKVIVDDHVYEDDYLLVEVLNIKSIGPNLILAPSADPTDGNFEVALLQQSSRKVFATYLRRLRQQIPVGRGTAPWQIITAHHDIIIECDSRTIHVDDELVAFNKGKKLEIAIRPGIVNILT